MLAAIAERLTPAIIAMGSVPDLGTRGGELPARTARRTRAFTARLAELLAEHDDDAAGRLRARRDAGCPTGGCAGRWRRRPGAALVHPVFFGSAITGAGRRTR